MVSQPGRSPVGAVAMEEPAAVNLAELELAVEAALGARAGVAGDEPVIGDQAARLRALVDAAEGPVARPRVVREAAIEHIAPMSLAPLTITVASGKGGVGKTNVATNLAAVLAGRGHRVTLLDADLGTANADVLCGVSVSARLEHVLTGELGVHDGARRTLRDIVIDVPGGFRLIPGSAGIGRLTELSAIDRRTLVDGINALERETDVLIVDAAAGIGSEVMAFAEASDVCLVVSTPEPTSLADAYALLKCAAARAGECRAWGLETGPRFQLVMNQCVDAGEARRVGARLAAVCDRFLGMKVPMAGWIAQDVRVMEAVRARELVWLRSPGCEAARNLSELGAQLAQDLEIPREQAMERKKRSGLASALRRMLGC